VLLVQNRQVDHFSLLRREKPARRSHPGCRENNRQV